MYHLFDTFEIVVLPIRWKIVRKGRYFVDLAPLMKVDDDGESPEYRKAAREIVQYLDDLEKVSGWNDRNGKTLVQALLDDWEPAHTFVALNAENIYAYHRGDVVTSSQTNVYQHLHRIACGYSRYR